MINLTGFALVGGPATQDHPKAVSTLQQLDRPYLCAVPATFQARRPTQPEPFEITNTSRSCAGRRQGERRCGRRRSLPSRRWRKSILPM